MGANLAPIVLFVYNRPWHTRQTLESLMRNSLAKESELYIYADGAKANASNEQLSQIEETRDIIKKKQWCGKVHIIEAVSNKGLANSIIEGVTQIINEYGKIIVLEDDLITSSGFLKYMNETLSHFQKVECIMHISGYVFPIKKKINQPFFIKGGTSTWGWGTWKRAWDNFELNGEKLYTEISHCKSLTYRFNFNGEYDYLSMLKDSFEGKNNSWGIRWYASVFLLDGLGLFPHKSLIENIGHDGSGTHCNSSTQYLNKSLIENISIENVINIEENEIAKKEFIKFYKRINANSITSKIKSKIAILFRLKSNS